MLRKNKPIKTNKMFRILSIALIGLISSVILFVSKDTYSFFSDRISSGMSVSTASVESILEKLHVKQENPKEINIKKHPGLDLNPTFNFEVLGDAKNYIQLSKYSITLISKTSGSDISIDPIPGVISPSDKVYGTIKVTGLNGFISTIIPIEFEPEYFPEVKPPKSITPTASAAQPNAVQETPDAGTQATPLDKVEAAASVVAPVIENASGTPSGPANDLTDAPQPRSVSPPDNIIIEQ